MIKLFHSSGHPLQARSKALIDVNHWSDSVTFFELEDTLRLQSFPSRGKFESSERSSGHGDVSYGTGLEAVKLSINGELKESQDGELRDRIYAIKKVLAKSNLRLSYDGGETFINVTAYDRLDTDFEDYFGYGACSLGISLHCGDPFWYGFARKSLNDGDSFATACDSVFPVVETSAYTATLGDVEGYISNGREYYPVKIHSMTTGDRVFFDFHNGFSWREKSTGEITLAFIEHFPELDQPSGLELSTSLELEDGDVFSYSLSGLSATAYYREKRCF